MYLCKCICHVCTYVQKSRMALGAILYHCIFLLRQSCSLNLRLVFSYQCWKSASPREPISTVLGTPITGVQKSLDLLAGCWDPNWSSWLCIKHPLKIILNTVFNPLMYICLCTCLHACMCVQTHMCQQYSCGSMRTSSGIHELRTTSVYASHLPTVVLEI